MKKIIFSFCVFISASLHAQNKDYPIQAIPFTDVKFTDHFWSDRIETNRTATIPASFSRCENTGRVKNFVMAAQKTGKFCTTYPFDDTDIYKTIEGASFSLAVHPDKKLETYIDSLITIIKNAQEPDGYLYTARTIDPLHPHAWSGLQRWVNEHINSHELYNAGHMYEAAYAHYLATGKRNFLDIALKNADLLVSVFGPDKMHVAPGHEVVEMGLVKLYRITGKKEYLDLAKFFVDERGKRQYNAKSKNPWENGMYWQDHKPVIEQDEATGHAVRAMYLYSAMADVAALTGDTSYLHAIDKIWENVVSKKLYVQGGIGAIGDGERFGDNYELPNLTAYNETCAAIGMVFWNERMFLLHGDAKYIDVLEKTLYNGLISGVGMDGKSFFYTNGMQMKSSFTGADTEPQRSGWFECSCCPTNVARLIPSIPGYVYAKKDNDIYVNLFISGSTKINLDNKKFLQITQENNYPWDGNLKFVVSSNSNTDYALMIRIPGWAQDVAIPSNLYNFENASAQKTVIKINGQAISYEMKNGYAALKRNWKKNDVIEIALPMEVKKIKANDNVKDDNGRIALQYGPIIYCAEWVDNNGKTSNLVLPDDAKFTVAYHRELLNGVEVLKSEAYAININSNGETVTSTKQDFVAIPYYAWAHRGKGEMNVWFPVKIKSVDIITSK